MTSHDVDVLVIGSGIAGLTFALKAASMGSVMVITKKERAETNTNYARGGIAAVVGDDDDLDLHVEDTLVAGAGLCHRSAVEILVREGPARVRELVEWGTAFHRGEAGRLSLGREGGHSRRRIVHAGDRTGRAIETALLQAVEEEPGITVVEDHLAVDLLLAPDPTSHAPLCRGVLALDHRHGRLVTIRSRVTFLASGGCGQVYRHTTNPSIATGDGVAMAYRAGARVANMEFIQFHPTALFPTEDPAFLISEAVRGEGAVLRRLDGSAFMDLDHPLGSLAPRDVVARAIHREMRERGDDHAVLDVSSIPPATFTTRFPGTTEGLEARGIDAHRDGIPVVPAAHYVCGGVVTDARARTSLAGLWAAGEVACTGVHGANRLASNSLLEAVVFSHRAALSVEEHLSLPDAAGVDHWLPGGIHPAETPGGVADDGDGGPTIAGVRRELRDLMWASAGIVRTGRELEEAEHRVRLLLAREERRWREEPWSPAAMEARNLLLTARLIVASARRRPESRGLHHTLDHPWRDNERCLRDTVLKRGEGDV